MRCEPCQRRARQAVLWCCRWIESGHDRVFIGLGEAAGIQSFRHIDTRGGEQAEVMYFTDVPELGSHNNKT